MTNRQTADLSSVGIPSLASSGTVELTPARKEALVDTIIAYGEKYVDENERVCISERLGRCLDVDYSAIRDSRLLSLMSLSELRSVAESGVSLGLHTHRHIFPAEEAAAAQELSDNRRALAEVGGQAMRHFCYPSGEWVQSHWKVLREHGVESAVTCDAGLNYASTPAYALKRTLDSARMSQIEFESELVGYMEFVRKLRRVISGHPRN